MTNYGAFDRYGICKVCGARFDEHTADETLIHDRIQAMREYG